MIKGNWTKETIMAQFKKRNNNEIAWDDEDGECKYKTDNGNCCFVGAFIPHTKYNSGMENQSVDALLRNNPELKKFMPLDLKGLEFMQDVHDGYEGYDGDDLYELIEEELSIAMSDDK